MNKHKITNSTEKPRRLRLEPAVTKIRVQYENSYTTKTVKIGSEKSALLIVKYKGIWENDYFQVFEFYIYSICH